MKNAFYSLISSHESLHNFVNLLSDLSQCAQTKLSNSCCPDINCFQGLLHLEKNWGKHSFQVRLFLKHSNQVPQVQLFMQKNWLRHAAQPPPQAHNSLHSTSLYRKFLNKDHQVIQYTFHNINDYFTDQIFLLFQASDH